jgi:uncharacterized protein (TIGR03382 family)
MGSRSFKAPTATLAALALAGCVSPDGSTLGSEDRAVTSQRALSAFSRIDRVAKSDDGLPYFVRGNLGKATGAIADVAQAESALAAALPKIGAAFGVDAADLTATKIQRDKLGMTHVRFAQSKNGLPVVGGELIVHIAADGAIRSVTGNARDAELTATPSILPSRAAELARRTTADGASTLLAEPELTYLIPNGGGALRLAWAAYASAEDHLQIERVFVDALSGDIIERHGAVHTAKNRLIRDAAGGSYPFALNGRQVGSEGMPPSGDPIALAAYDNTGETWDCYNDVFERDSYDGAGAQIKSTVHIVFPDGQGGTSGNNAAWVYIQQPPLSIATMAYGDGDGEFMGPTPNGLDVTAHELTHGVISLSANLTYNGESGALNEGYADIMAAVCESRKDGAVSADTWLVGEDIFTPATPGDALRYMADPTADADLYPPALGGSRDYYPLRYTGTEDQGGVHLNSGIANLAFQLLVDGGTHPQARNTIRVPGIGIESAGQIFYNALTTKMTMGTTFAQARTAIEEAAGELYGPREVAAVGLAWAAVGVGEPPADVDLTPPTVSITSPADGDEVEAGFTVTVTAADDEGVTKVELKIDGTVVGTDTTAPYSFTTADDLAAGEHTVEAIAYDTINTASDEITVTIAEPGSDDPGSDDPGSDDPGSDDPGSDDPGDDNPGDDDGGGGCSAAGSSGAASGSLLLMLGLALARRRRR